MVEEVISSLNLKHGAVVVDATVAGGGHSLEILKMITPGGRLIGIDADSGALNIAHDRLKGFNGSFLLINDNFRNIDRILSKENIKGVDAILLDLGISSYQLEDAARGFSIKHDSRLDMRMDQKAKTTAYDIINRYSEKDLSEIIEKYGEERFHSRIARRINQARQKKPIETTQELAGIIHRTVGYRYGNSRIDPATRTFQAIRIEVNDELGSLEEGLKSAVFWLKTGGRIVVISFHSLEDRIVKNLFKGYSKLGILRIITKKPLAPSRDEIFNNPRARSAKMRAAERIK
jgi:16S rRNA (cytosine1402-N4)-methyltransferase